MNHWLRWIGGVVLMGLAWAAVWAAVGALIATMHLAASADKMWVPVAYPGFLCGAIFSAVMGTGGRGRRLDLLRSGAFGLVIGLFVGALPFAISTPTTDLPMWRLGVEIIGPVALLSAFSAIASTLLPNFTARSAPTGPRSER